MVDELRAFIAIAEACHREKEPSYSWHILDWRSYRLSLKYPLVRECDRIINFNVTS
jgi:hypothetical protein